MASEETFLEFADSQFDSPEKRFADFAANPRAIEVLGRIPMKQDEIYHKDFLELEEIAHSYGLSSVNALKLVIDHWRGKELSESPANG